METSEYCIIVNRKELYDTAIEKGFQDIMLIGDSLSEDDISTMKSTAKSYALFYFDESGNTREDKITKAIRDAGINCRYWRGFSWWDWEADTDVNSIEEAIRQFPEKKYVEEALINLGYIHDTDYTNRCGNCTEYMGLCDKYCRYCGARRGEGRFLPFYNQSTVLYGAPLVKRKYKCDNCGYLWITDFFGDENSLFCPMCGCNEIRKIEEEERDMLGDYIGTEEPYEPDKRPQFFSADEAWKLFEARRKYRNQEWIADATKDMEEAGISVPKEPTGQLAYPLKEADGDRITLAGRILMLGNDADIHNEHCCPHCGSHIIADASGWSEAFCLQCGEHFR